MKLQTEKVQTCQWLLIVCVLGGDCRYCRFLYISAQCRVWCYSLGLMDAFLCRSFLLALAFTLKAVFACGGVCEIVCAPPPVFFYRHFEACLKAGQQSTWLILHSKLREDPTSITVWDDNPCRDDSRTHPDINKSIFLVVLCSFALISSCHGVIAKSHKRRFDPAAQKKRAISGRGGKWASANIL